ncbi:AAA family ATPase [Actinocorallia sp. A-T 12471]|uniref:AAA family ATPase n=1 Tax=Actinocorallia sp. A-T 12471 TaxID=3089813 RepID=UPI0029CEAD0A|nr:AAA family ATPase [Actinocorallia sp. A-T 12471]MDX6744989.1 AAA family ATPase [Actinocorallia sp. A-T 12471]
MPPNNPHPGWTPSKLKAHRESHTLSPAAAAQKLRELSTQAGLKIAADIRTLQSHENGTTYPDPHHRRAYCLLYQSTEPELGFRLPLPQEQPTNAQPSPPRTDEAAAVLSEAFDQLTNASQNHDPSRSLTTAMVEAWQARASGPSPKSTTLVLIGGYAGSGKSELAGFLSAVSGWAILDKDSLTRRLVERLLVSLGGDQHDRHTDLYLSEIRPLEYKCLMDAAFDNLDCGISAILSAPFVTEYNDEAWMSRLTNRCEANGIDVIPVWVRCDEDSMREHIDFRDSPRDAWKLANWHTYAADLNTITAPPGARVTIDNRHGAAITVLDQTREALRKILA